LPEIKKDKRFRYGVAIVENKRWDRPLDRATKGTRKGDIEREVPSSQVLRYLSRAETLSDRRIQRGILSNGRLCRLYYQGAKSRLEEYLEIDLSRLVDAPSLSDLLTERDEETRAHWLCVFALMFGRASFVEQSADGRTFHLLALDEGRNWEGGSRATCPTWSSGGCSPISSAHWMRPTRIALHPALMPTCAS
jgi:hypothetical protein